MMDAVNSTVGAWYEPVPAFKPQIPNAVNCNISIVFLSLYIYTYKYIHIYRYEYAYIYIDIESRKPSAISEPSNLGKERSPIAAAFGLSRACFVGGAMPKV